MSLDMARKIIFPERESHSVSKAPGIHIDLPVSASLGQGVKDTRHHALDKEFINLVSPTITTRQKQTVGEMA